MGALGAGGIKFWFNSPRTPVADNEIAHTGMIFLTSYGICVMDSPGNQIIYNHIYDRHYTGILVGWAMNFEESNAFGNVVEHNHVHDIGKGEGVDMGGIYTEGICARSRIRDNGLGFAEWQAAGKDLHSIIGDPLFVDPERGDFRLRPGSPTAQIGFEPWDLSSVGPRPSSAESR